MSSDSTAGSSGGSSPEKSKRLRRPHPATEERLRNGEFDPNQNTAPVMKSKLSADAPEFVPKFSYIPPDQQQDDLYQDFQRLVSIRPSHLSAVTTTGPSGKDSIADIFKDAVFSLTSNPAPMEEYMKRVTDLLNNDVTDTAVINDIIETLFEQSISEPNFRFTGAKICKYLSHQLKGHPVFSNFRGLFLNRCKSEFVRRQELLNNNLERLCGLSMFFGELFLVLEIEHDGYLVKIGLLRSAISDLLRTLLSSLDDVTVKCATQLLKLTGTALMETTDLQGNFDDIFDKIKSLEKHPQLNKTSHCLINSVLSRLEYNFGVGQQPSPQKPVQTFQGGQQSTDFDNEPIFYNTEGQPITREEAGYDDIIGLNSEEQEAFLQWEAENYANQQWNEQGGDGFSNQGQWSDGAANGYVQQPWSTGMSDYTQWSADQEQGGFGYNEADLYGDYSSDMDDEMAAAYEMFLKESGQSRH
ncbi:polyadenylate-binding protein-interacting protein 1-like [Ruditapes philippinarum]|uniref:polyadenylate-binding protein-interacting protein 1-like n=1 Tax=Ruditapes philippinarum TaxID=129788 RepID=UPI00295BFA62|nr:polyadenylate-binding protein-interacting protein 1-like [Ruditapes philippinarum]